MMLNSLTICRICGIMKKTADTAEIGKEYI